MKQLTKIALATALVFGFAQAKDKDFSLDLSTQDSLKVGQNKVLVSIKSKTIPVYDANVKLRIYKQGKLLSNYQTNKINQNGQYTFNVNLPQQGEYKYVSSFSRKGGVVHVRKGDLNITN